MKLKDDFFPYPVLSKTTDDYEGAHFETNIETYVIDKINIEVKVSFILDDKSLESLVASGKAKYLLHIEGVNSSFRKYFLSEKNSSEIRGVIKIEEAGKTFQLNTLLVANEKINEFNSPNFNRDFYEGYSIKNILKGQILALEKTSILDIDFSNKDREEDTPPMEFRPTKKKYLSYDFEADDIIVELPEDTYEIYIALSNSNEAQRSLFLIAFVLPALTLAIKRLQDGIEMQNIWEQVIKNKLEDLGEYGNRFQNKQPEELAQLLIDNPLNKVMLSYKKYIDRRQE